MIKGFDFEDSGRTYSCSVEERRGATIETWWWFTVTQDVHRYAPFQAVSNDTRASVQERIVKYYTDLLFRRSQPPEPRAHWGQRNRPAARTAEQPAVAADAAKS